MNRSMKDYHTRPERQARPVHGDQTIYVVWVLWLVGFTEQQIARRIGLSKKQVAGLVARSDYSNRSAMSYEDRQQRYQDLIQARFDDGGGSIDGGVLKSLPDRVLPLKGKQKRGGE